jgi:hypothetical protein
METLKQQRDRVGFKLISDHDKFSVVREGNKIHSSVDFSCTDTGIRVSEFGGAVLLDASLTLDDDGECRLKVTKEDKLLTLPQFRKRALEKLFFQF